MEVILDTNFIISSILKKIDFISELQGMGFNVVVPREVMHELKDLRAKNKTSHDGRVAIDLALELLNSRDIKKIRLREGFVDKGLISKGLEGIYIATLDNEIRGKVPNRVIISNATKSLVVERD